MTISAFIYVFNYVLSIHLYISTFFNDLILSNLALHIVRQYTAKK